MGTIFDLIFNIVFEIVLGISIVYDKVFGYFVIVQDSVFENSVYFFGREVNISLFSDNIIFTANVAEIIVFTITTILLVIIIRFLIKATKKFITMIFGVFRV